MHAVACQMALVYELKLSKKMVEISIAVSYSQIAVFDAEMVNPFNDWTPQHVSQGFAWRPGSVAFRTLEEAEHYNVNVMILKDDIDSSEEAIHAIWVPFEVPIHGVVEIGSISDGVQIELPQGEYNLLYEELGNRQLRLSFVVSAEPHFEVLKSISTPIQLPLLITAEAA
jgi:hypothetical protein